MRSDPLRGGGRLMGNVAMVFYAVVYALVMMWFGGADFTHLYAPSPYHRLQADALLRGELSIGSSMGQIGHDLAWHSGQVNQIWGLGIGIWLAPFEFVWRLFGQQWFPDRIALGFAFALLGGYSWSLGRWFAEAARRKALGIGCVWLILLCPAVWAMNEGGRPVYEETSLYALLVSLGILIATARVACLGLRRDFFVCAVLAALSALVRPTHGIYGLSGMLVCSFLLLKRSSFCRSVLLGNALFVAGLACLLATNWLRFGSPMEFGHRLTITGESVVYMTRIGNPMREATAFQAGKELVSWLFLNHRLRARGDEEHRVPWQAPQARWRDPYMITFDPGWAIVVLAGFAGTLLWLLRKYQAGWRLDRAARTPGMAVIAGIFAWSSISMAGLLAFYLRFPNMSARYLMDFAPAFTGFALLLWFWISNRWPLCGLLGLSAWLGFGIMTVQLRPQSPPVLKRSEIPLELPRSTMNPFAGIHGSYDLTNHPSNTAILGNGAGWNSGTGEVKALVALAIDQPRFIEVTVGPGIYKAGGSRQDVYRAVLDGKFIPLEKMERHGEALHLRFEVPQAIRRRAGDELLFLCFTKGYDKADRESRRVLYSVRWRETSD